jgi:hypothetical protein
MDSCYFLLIVLPYVDQTIDLDRQQTDDNR